MPKIDDISFAKLVSGGKVYRSTCLVYKDKIDGRWWRKNGSAFSPEDFDEAIASKPETIILGVGFMNKVSVLPETLERFEKEGIAVEVIDCQPAMERFNSMIDSGKHVIGAFHLM